MKRTRVKICGITHESDRDVAVTAGADAIGLISNVPVETPREIDAETARDLADGLPPFVSSVLVTMPRSVQNAVRLQETVGADAIQIHGGLEPSYIGGLKNRVDASIIAAIDGDEPRIDEFAAVADMLLVDSTTETGAGGTGETHDWKQSRKIVEKYDIPVTLAGGLRPENVSEAINTVQPYAVDTASGVESTGGRKDHDAIRVFINNARGNSTNRESEVEA